MIVCEYCNKEFKSKYVYHSNRNLKNHITHCINNPSRIDYICKYCNKEETTIGKIGSHVSTCEKNPNYKEILRRKKEVGRDGRPHTQESKDKISNSMKEYLKENPDKVPYLLNHSSKESYPEKYFTQVFENEKIPVTKKYRIGLYELDFCNTDKKIDIEIDGSQHQCDKKIIQSDIKRTKFLESNGWKVIRVDWSKYKKLNRSQKELYISELKSIIY